jgi:hypothetical protein
LECFNESDSYFDSLESFAINDSWALLRTDFDEKSFFSSWPRVYDLDRPTPNLRQPKTNFYIFLHCRLLSFEWKQTILEKRKYDVFDSITIHELLSSI